MASSDKDTTCHERLFFDRLRERVWIQRPSSCRWKEEPPQTLTISGTSAACNAEYLIGCGDYSVRPVQRI